MGFCGKGFGGNSSEAELQSLVQKFKRYRKKNRLGTVGSLRWVSIVFQNVRLGLGKGTVQRQDCGTLESCTKVNRGTPGYIEHKYKSLNSQTVQSDSSPQHISASFSDSDHACDHVIMSPGDRRGGKCEPEQLIITIMIIRLIFIKVRHA